MPIIFWVVSIFFGVLQTPNVMALDKKLSAERRSLPSASLDFSEAKVLSVDFTGQLVLLSFCSIKSCRLVEYRRDADSYFEYDLDIRRIASASLSHDGRYIALSERSKDHPRATFLIINREDGKVRGVPSLNQAIEGLRFRPDSREIVFARSTKIEYVDKSWGHVPYEWEIFGLDVLSLDEYSITVDYKFLGNPVVGLLPDDILLRNTWSKKVFRKYRDFERSYPKPWTQFVTLSELLEVGAELSNEDFYGPPNHGALLDVTPFGAEFWIRRRQAGIASRVIRRTGSTVRRLEFLGLPANYSSFTSSGDGSVAYVIVRQNSSSVDSVFAHVDVEKEKLLGINKDILNINR